MLVEDAAIADLVYRTWIKRHLQALCPMIRMLVLLSAGVLCGFVFRFPTFALCSVVLVMVYVAVLLVSRSSQNLMIEALLALFLLQIGYFSTVAGRVVYLTIKRRRGPRGES
jgi:hypothetical protein